MKTPSSNLRPCTQNCMQGTISNNYGNFYSNLTHFHHCPCVNIKLHTTPHWTSEGEHQRYLIFGSNFFSSLHHFLFFLLWYPCITVYFKVMAPHSLFLFLSLFLPRCTHRPLQSGDNNIHWQKSKFKYFFYFCSLFLNHVCIAYAMQGGRMSGH